jgi:hypothetical protein
LFELPSAFCIAAARIRTYSSPAPFAVQTGELLGLGEAALDRSTRRYESCGEACRPGPDKTSAAARQARSSCSLRFASLLRRCERPNRKPGCFSSTTRPVAAFYIANLLSDTASKAFPKQQDVALTDVLIEVVEAMDREAGTVSTVDHLRAIAQCRGFRNLVVHSAPKRFPGAEVFVFGSKNDRDARKTSGRMLPERPGGEPG